MVRMLVVLGIGVGLGVAAQPTAEALLTWAQRHWEKVGLGAVEALLADFAPGGGVAFLGGPADGLYAGPALATGWERFLRAVAPQGLRILPEPRAFPESGLVHGLLELAGPEGPVTLEAYLRFSPEGQLLGADYVVVEGLLPRGPQADGEIGAGEYPQGVEDPRSRVSLFWRNGWVVFLGALRSPGTGWVAVGFDPVNRMQGANYLIAAVTGAGLLVEDHYGTGPTTHRRDRREDLLRAAGRIAGGATVVEFVIPLDSGDPEDKPLRPGRTYTVLLAYHRSSPSFAVQHTARGAVQIALEG